jgi:hypothetical protein
VKEAAKRPVLPLRQNSSPQAIDEWTHAQMRRRQRCFRGWASAGWEKVDTGYSRQSRAKILQSIAL